MLCLFIEILYVWKKNFWYVDNMYKILRLLDWVEYDKVLNNWSDELWWKGV